MIGSKSPFNPFIMAIFRYLLALVNKPAAYLGVILKALQIIFSKNSKQVIVSLGLLLMSISPISIAGSP